MNGRCGLIALDMDGTLLKSDKTVSPDTVRDIRLASAAGAQVVFCTGRSVAELRRYFALFPTMRYAVCCSGALVYDRETGASVFRRAICRELSEKIVRTGLDFRAMIHFLTGEESVVSEDDVTHMADFHMSVFQPDYEKICRLVPDMAAECSLHDGMEKINLYFRTPEDRAGGYERLKGLPLTFAFAEETSLEMTALGVTKALGLQRLMAYLGVPRERTAGVGDAENDLEMLKLVAHSVAMGNAAEEIRRQCDEVTADNDHNGAGLAVRKITRSGSL